MKLMGNLVFRLWKKLETDFSSSVHSMKISSNWNQVNGFSGKEFKGTVPVVP